jgi:hypothetical protein
VCATPLTVVAASPETGTVAVAIAAFVVLAVNGYETAVPPSIDTVTTPAGVPVLCCTCTVNVVSTPVLYTSPVVVPLTLVVVVAVDPFFSPSSDSEPPSSPTAGT